VPDTSGEFLALMLGAGALVGVLLLVLWLWAYLRPSPWKLPPR
jgi:hypothetical protein